MAGKAKKNNEDNIPEGLDDLLNELTGNKSNKEDNIPEGLDDLLNEIKGKKSTATKPKRKRGRPRKKKTSPPGALTKYSKTEDVDSRILELLGLEYTFDLDYDDYANLLKEKLIEVSRGTEDFSTEDAMLLREELKKARENEGKGTFKVKKKISKDSFTNFNVGRPKKDTAQTRKPAYGLLQGKKIAEKSQRVNDLKEEKKERKQSDNQILKSISKSLDRIIGILSKQLKFDKDQAEKQRKLEESGKRKDKENKMESAFSKGLKAVAKVASKVFDPLKDFFGKIIRFFIFVFLGKAFQKFIKWYEKGDNKKKLENVGRLLKTFLPAILAGLAFLSPLGGIIAKAISVISFGVGKLVAVIPKLLKFASANPKTAAALAAAGGAIALGARVKSEMDEDLKNQQTPTPSDPKKPQSTVNSRFDMESDQGYINDKPVSLDEYNSFKNMDDSEKVQKYGTSMKGGGEVPGSGPNKDTVPAMLAPGEFVMSRGAVQRYGSDTLASMNAAGGGTNIPMISNGVTYAKSGGYMGGEGKEESKIQPPRESLKPEHIGKGLDINKRHAELMKSTNPNKISDYDAKHGQGAYSAKLKEKLGNIYSSPQSSTPVQTAIKPTGKVVGRENLPAATIARLEKIDAQKAGSTQPSMQYTKNGRKISAKKFNRVKGMMGAAKKGGAKGVLNHMISGAKGMIGGMFGKLQGAINNPKGFIKSMGGTVVDGNVGKPTAQEQRDINTLAAKKAKLQQSQQSLMGLKSPKKSVQDDPLFAEYQQAFDNPNHPLHEKVAGDLFTDKDPIRFEEFKKLMGQQSQQTHNGLVKENTGMDIPGGGTDRQRIDVQPGEFLFTKETVEKAGGPNKLNRIVADLDSNSTPAKMGLRNKDISEGILPYSVNSSGDDLSTVNLPMTGMSGGPMVGAMNGSNDEFHSPFFDEAFDERQRILDTMGITAFA